ncbi:MAG: hypothetical protein NZM12_11670 [Steroidobacteraceae bacterium]|nr:hypothetical protein [Steroidobacteraceae bacterium]MDW8258074.1 hypothetical protein [Gammaproteobacteria bacterium]
MSVAPAAEISPYDRLLWPDELLIEWLASGARRKELQLYFGPHNYADLAQLARAARAAPRRETAPLVWILPGIMGSQLGIERSGGAPPDLLWLDPVDWTHGHLRKLRVDGDSPVRAFGVLHFSYLRLLLRLLAAGFDTRTYPYDWRLDVRVSASRFAAALRAVARPAAIVAHSLGGLVARAALAYRDLPPIERVVLLGVPNAGAYGALQALRGSYPVVSRLAMLDRVHGAERLAAEVFATLPSLYQLLPQEIVPDGTWPLRGPQPHVQLWRDVCSVQTALAAPDERFSIIAGRSQPTVFGAECSGAEWVYRYARCGDGTVPLRSALLGTAPCYLTGAAHGDLPRDAQVAAAVAELLHNGTTTLLPRLDLGRATDPDASSAASVGDDELRRPFSDKLDWSLLSHDRQREFLENLNAPVPLPSLAAL